MCTLSWQTCGGDALTVLFNRDERRTRLRAHPPTIERAGGIARIAPRDADAGGTWIFANARGLVGCLLNRFAPVDPSRTFTSRGQLLLGLSDASGIEAAAARVEQGERSRFQPFTLVLLAPGAAPRCAEWDGVALAWRSLAETDRPLLSSGYDLPGVGRARRAEFARLLRDGGAGFEGIAAGEGAGDVAGAAVGGAADSAAWRTSDALEAFHRSHRPERGPYSTCMHRDDASTVSLTRIDVDLERVVMRYHDGAPCEALGVHQLEIERVG